MNEQKINLNLFLSFIHYYYYCYYYGSNYILILNVLKNAYYIEVGEVIIDFSAGILIILIFYLCF